MNTQLFTFDNEQYLALCILSVKWGKVEGGKAWRAVTMYLPTRTVNNMRLVAVEDVKIRAVKMLQANNKRVSKSLWTNLLQLIEELS